MSNWEGLRLGLAVSAIILCGAVIAFVVVK